MRRVRPTVPVAALAVVAALAAGCATPEQKATDTLAGNWRGAVQIVGAPAVEIRLNFQKNGRYTEVRSISGFPGFNGGGAWGIKGTQLSFAPTNPPPPNAAPAAARALLPLSGAQTLTIYGPDRVRIGELDLARDGAR